MRIARQAGWAALLAVVLGATTASAVEPTTQQRIVTNAVSQLEPATVGFHGWHRAWYYGSGPYSYGCGYGGCYGYGHVRPSLYYGCRGGYCGGYYGAYSYRPYAYRGYAPSYYSPYVYSGAAVSPYYQPYIYAAPVYSGAYYSPYSYYGANRPYYAYPSGYYRYGYYAYPSYRAFGYPYSYRGHYGYW
jgi:hypothetical protein